MLYHGDIELMPMVIFIINYLYSLINNCIHNLSDNKLFEEKQLC